MSGYTPLFSSIVRSSIWDEDAKTCKVWVTMLALADMHGIVEGSLPGLAHEARVTRQECATALRILMAPDPDSRTPEDEGRRIKEVDGGWLVINHAKYRRKAKSRAAYMKNYREEKKKQEKKNIQTHTQTQTGVTSVTQCNTPVTDVTVTQYSIEDCKNGCFRDGIPESNAQSYFDHYNAQGWVRANGQSIKNLASHMKKVWNEAKRCWVFDEKPQQRKTVDDSFEQLKREGRI